MLWTIMVLTMPTRKQYLRRLLDALEPQIENHPDVEIMIRMCDPMLTLGENREIMRQQATGMYQNFCDDDDLPSCEYVKTILPLLDGVDIVGFECALYVDGELDPHRDFHTITAGSWYNTPSCFYRDISHLSPIRRELALLAPMEGGHGEDGRWADRMRALGVLKTEHYIADKIMYYYLYRNGKNRGVICTKCGRDSTVMVEEGTFCNACGTLINRRDVAQKSCLWF